MNLELNGKLLVKYDTNQVTERFKKREFVIEMTEDINGNAYTNYAKMQLSQNKCELLDNLNVGDSVKISFNIKGNRWERDGKVNYMTQLDAWRIEKIGTAAAQPQQAAFYNPAPENTDDLPF